MSYVVTFHNARPSAREGAPWTQVRVDEASAAVGPWTPLQTQTLSPVDTDPEAPAARNITCALATLSAGWYRLAFIDADGNQEITSAVHRGVSTFASQQDIAARLGRDLTDSEETQVTILLELATGLIAEAANADQAWVDALLAEDADDAPLTYRLICVEAVLRGLQNPQGFESQTETLGAYSHTERWGGASAGGGLLLTVEEERRIRRAARGNRFQAVTLVSPYSGTSADDQPELPL